MGSMVFYLKKLLSCPAEKESCNFLETNRCNTSKLHIYLFSLFLFIICYPSTAQDNKNLLQVAANTPCWSEPSPYAKFVFVITRESQVQATGETRYFIINRGSIYSKILMREFLYRNKKYWLCREIQINKNRAKGEGLLNISANTLFPDILYSISIFVLLALLALWMNFYHHQFKDEIWVKYKHLWLLLILLALHYIWLGFFLSKTVQWGHYPQDEVVYFADIKSFLANGLQNRFTVTIGISLFYLPFVYFTGAQSMYDIAPLVSWTSALIIAPASIAFIFLLIRNITKSVWFAFAALALFMLLPKIYLCAEDARLSAFSLYFTRPDNYGFICYQQILTGFNSMRDTPSTCMMLALMLLALKLRAGTWRYIIISALFAIACHLRINNVYFAPLVAYIFWHSDKKLLKDYPYTIRMLLYSLLAFFLFYSPQLLLNNYHNGGIFTFPNMYVKNSSSYGFEPGYIPVNIPYLFNIHYLYYGVFAGSCLLIKDSYKRNLLIFWVVPMTIFFCGFRIFGGQPYRYLLTVLPGTIAALMIAAEELRMRVNKPKNLYLLVFLLLILVFPVLPIYGIENNIYADFWATKAKHYIAPAACTLVMLWYWKEKEWTCLCAVGIYSVIFLSSSATFLFSLLVLLLAWAVISWGREIWIVLAKRYSTENSEPPEALKNI